MPGASPHGSSDEPLPADPAKALVAAVGHSATQPVHITMTMGGKTLQTGVVDRPKYFEVVRDSYTIRRIGPELYFKLHGSVLGVLGGPSVYQANVGTKWVHMSVPRDAEDT